MIQNGIDLTKNPKQYEYFVMASAAAQGKVPYRKLAFGGAIRGGKTYVSLGLQARFCGKFPGSKHHVIRKDFPALQDTAIPSLQKILQGSPNWKWNRDKSNFFAYHKNDSKIFFKGENFKQDPELNDFLGLETNTILLEQAEELQKKTLQIATSRVGSWYIDPMPTGLILMTFNPTQKWPKKEIYLKHINGELPPRFFLYECAPRRQRFRDRGTMGQLGYDGRAVSTAIY